MNFDAVPEITGENGFYNVRFVIPAESSDAGERIFDWAVGEGLKILIMNRHRLSLEDIFVKLTGDEKENAKDIGNPEASDGNP
jgi:hypothetical protein